MLSFKQCLLRHAGGRCMQCAYGLCEWRQTEAMAQFGRQRFRKISLGQCLLYALAQYRLGYAVRSRVDGCQGVGQRLTRFANAWMHDLRAVEALPDFAAYTYTLAGLNLAPLIRVEMQPSQVHAPSTIRNRSHQLAARPELHLAEQNLCFKLHSSARQGGADTVYAGFVLISNGQMDDEIRWFPQAQPLKFPFELAARSVVTTALGGRFQIGRAHV